MANPEHLAKLKEGVEAWNKWRKDNPKIKRVYPGFPTSLTTENIRFLYY